MRISNSTQSYPLITTRSADIKDRLPVVVNVKTGQPFQLSKRRAGSDVVVLQPQTIDDVQQADFVKIFSTSAEVGSVSDPHSQLPRSVQQYLQVANLGQDNRDNSRRLIDEKV